MLLSRRIAGFCLVSFLACAAPVSAATITSDYYQGVATTSGPTPQNLVFTGPATVAPQILSIASRTHPYGLGLPNHWVDETAYAELRGTAAGADNLHAYAESSVSTVWNPEGFTVDSLSGPRAFSHLGFTVTDAFLFTSAVLPDGSPVTFQLTAVLHSTLAATVTGVCTASGYAPAGAAGLAMTGPAQASLFTPLSHDTCGLGADVMSLTGVFSGAIGVPFGFRTTLAVNSSVARAWQDGPGEDYSIVDAGATANIFVTVLTPNVNFSAESGAAYTDPHSQVPEPSTVLLLFGMFALAVLRRRRT